MGDNYKQWVREFKKELAHEIEKELTAEVDDNIRKGFQKKELKWPPLSKEYQHYKKKEGRNTKGLIYHGALLKATDSRVKIDSKKIQIKVFNNMKYAAVHEFGSKKKNIPARPFIKPALEKTQKNLPKIIEKVFKRMR
jgi:phage gpG-like protein